MPYRGCGSRPHFIRELFSQNKAKIVEIVADQEFLMLLRFPSMNSLKLSRIFRKLSRVSTIPRQPTQMRKWITFSTTTFK